MGKFLNEFGIYLFIHRKHGVAARRNDGAMHRRRHRSKNGTENKKRRRDALFLAAVQIASIYSKMYFRNLIPRSHVKKNGTVMAYV